MDKIHRMCGVFHYIPTILLILDILLILYHLKTVIEQSQGNPACPGEPHGLAFAADTDDEEDRIE